MNLAAIIISPFYGFVRTVPAAELQGVMELTLDVASERCPHC
jgi:hypothetical protein